MVTFSISQPNWISVGSFVDFAEVAGGLFFSDYIASVTALAANLSGNAALAAKIGAKSVFGIGTFYFANKASGGTKDALWLMSLGAGASVIYDLLQRVYGEIFVGPAAAAAKATLGKSPRVRVSAPSPIESSGEKKASEPAV